MNFLKSIFLMMLVSVLIFGCQNNQKTSETLPADLVNNPKSASGEESTKGIPKITFENAEHDFGKVIQGEKITYAFKFSNTGNSDLIITDVSTSCGCTVPEFTKEPISPGNSGNIKVTFDSNNRKGYQNKTITVITNTNPNTTVLRIKAQVIVPEQY